MLVPVFWAAVTPCAVGNILGDVSNAGTYVLSAFSTVFHALYLAGGVSGLGSLRNITVNRNGKVAGTVDVYDFLMTGNRESDIRLEEGDVVMVKPYTCLVIIDGEVKRPMSFELKEGETMSDLLEYAGGFTNEALSENVTVVRQNGRNYEIRTVDESQYPTFRLEDGDQVTVERHRWCAKCSAARGSGDKRRSNRRAPLPKP